MRTRLPHLVDIDDEILAQNGQGTGRASLSEESERTLEVELVGEHRQAGGAAGCIGAGMAGRIEIGADQALGRACLLDLGDQGEAGRGIERVTEAARRRLSGGTLRQIG